MIRDKGDPAVSSQRSRSISVLLVGITIFTGIWNAGCDRSRSQKLGDWFFEREALNGVITVKTLSGSVWGKPATVIEDLAIGVLEGADELMFGRILEMAADAEGGIYVFDMQVPALRYYDSTGQYVRTLGGNGSGPGEYRNQILGLGVRSDGRIVLRDPRNARLNIYQPDGSPLTHWPVASGLYTSQAMVLDTADHVYLKVLMESPQNGKPWKIGLLHLNAQGEVMDTIPEPQINGEPSIDSWLFSSKKVWTLSPQKDILVGVSSAYRFEIRKPDGSVVGVERKFEPVKLWPEEHAAHEARNAWVKKTQGQFISSEIPPVPHTKPAFRGMIAGERGRIWVHRYTAAVRVEEDPTKRRPDGPPPILWREPDVYDVFESDGTYLGEVPIPLGTSIYVFRGDTLWGVRRGELDESYVVRLHLTHQ